MSDVTVTFTVSSNDALLLLTCHDLITGVAPDDSIAGVDNFEWLLDEIARASDVYRDYKAEEARTQEQAVDQEYKERRDFLGLLSLSPRSYNALMRVGMRSLADVTTILAARPGTKYGIGAKTLRELADALERIGQKPE